MSQVRDFTPEEQAQATERLDAGEDLAKIRADIVAARTPEDPQPTGVVISDSPGSNTGFANERAAAATSLPTQPNQPVLVSHEDLAKIEGVSVPDLEMDHTEEGEAIPSDTEREVFYPEDEDTSTASSTTASTYEDPDEDDDEDLS